MKWNKCSEIMPKENSYYLVWSGNQYPDKWEWESGSPEVAWFRKEDNTFEINCCHQIEFARYWMPLPGTPLITEKKNEE